MKKALVLVSRPLMNECRAADFLVYGGREFRDLIV